MTSFYSIAAFLWISLVSLFAALNGTSAARSPGQSSGCGISQYDDAGIEGGTLPSLLIVGGWEARPDEFPWQVALKISVSSTTYRCGGSIVAFNYILTAAHCVSFSGLTGDGIQVIVGRHNLTSSSGKQYAVSEIIIHKHYDELTFSDDIALLKLTEPIEHTLSSSRICLPIVETGEYYNIPLIVSGWGDTEFGGHASDVLLYTRVNLMSKAYCQTCMGSSSFFLELYTICAGECHINEGDSCQGDSGGPLILERENGKFEIRGIVSWGRGCASRTPGVYTDVYYYRNWIASNANDAIL